MELEQNEQQLLNQPAEDQQKQQKHTSGSNEQSDSMLEIQRAYVNRFIKKHMPEYTASSEFKEQFAKALSLFIFYIQTFKPKKAYTPEDVLKVLENRGMGVIAGKLSEWNKAPVEAPSSPNKMDLRSLEPKE